MTFLAVGEAIVKMSKQPLHWFLMADKNQLSGRQARNIVILILIFDLHVE